MPSRSPDPYRHFATISKARKKPLLRRERFDGDLPEAKRHVGRLLEARKQRTRRTLKYPGFSGGLAAAGSVFTSLVRNPSFQQGVATAVGSGTLIAIASAGAVYGMHSPVIKQATQKVGAALGEMALKDSKLRNFLGQYRFIYIDGKGNIAGTNIPRLIPGVGRIRLSTRKILARSY